MGWSCFASLRATLFIPSYSSPFLLLHSLFERIYRNPSGNSCGIQLHERFQNLRVRILLKRKDAELHHLKAQFMEAACRILRIS